MVNKLSKFMYTPIYLHWQAAKRVLRYISGTKDRRIFLRQKNTLALHAFSDADWDGNRDDYISTSKYIVYLGSHPIAWSSKNQKYFARSSTDTAYHSVVDTTS